MVDKKDLLGVNYDKFKKESEEIISKYGYEDINRWINSNSYSDACSFVEFITDIYQLDYVKKIRVFAEERNFKLETPFPIKQNWNTDVIVRYIQYKKPKSKIEVFEMNFVKTQRNGRSRQPQAIKILKYEDSKISVNELSSFIGGINIIDREEKIKL